MVVALVFSVCAGVRADLYSGYLQPAHLNPFNGEPLTWRDWTNTVVPLNSLGEHGPYTVYFGASDGAIATDWLSYSASSRMLASRAIGKASEPAACSSSSCSTSKPGWARAHS
jgi:hypothetical protein